MTKILIAVLRLCVFATEASAQSRQYYDSSGKRIGRSATDSSGTVTTYDPRGNVVARKSTTGSTTTIYDARGRNVGRLLRSPLQPSHRDQRRPLAG